MINEKPHGNHSFEHQESKPPFSLTRIEKEISVNIREIVSVLCILVFLGAFPAVAVANRLVSRRNDKHMGTKQEAGT